MRNRMQKAEQKTMQGTVQGIVWGNVRGTAHGNVLGNVPKTVQGTARGILRLLVLIGALMSLHQPEPHAQTPIFVDDPAFRDDALVAIDSLYNRKPEVARELIRTWEEQHPDHPVWSAWTAMEAWWDVMANLDDLSNDEMFFNRMRRADYAASMLLQEEPDHPDGLLIKALANGYAARHHANRERWVTAVKIAYTSHIAYQRFMEVRPDFPDNKFVEGLKSYYAAFLIDEYPIVKPVSVFLPKGSREGGLDLLREASKTAVFTRAEASYFLAYILYDYEHDYERSIVYFRSLADRYPDNCLFQLYFVRTLGELGEFDELYGVATGVMERWERKQLRDGDVIREEMHYWLGRYYESVGRMDEAKEAYQQALEAGEQFDVTEGRTYRERSKGRLAEIENS